MTEHQIQRAIIDWFRYTYRDCFIFAIPNGGLRNKITAFKLKQEGVVSGVPDLMVLLKNGKSFFIEVKTEKGSLSKNQKAIIDKISNLNHNVIVCYGLNDCMELITKTVNNFFNLTEKFAKNKLDNADYSIHIDDDMCEQTDVKIENEQATELDDGKIMLSCGRVIQVGKNNEK